MTYKNKVIVDGVEIPKMLGTETLQRALGNKVLLEVWENYKSHKKQNVAQLHEKTPPTELQMKIAKLRKSGMRQRDVAVTFGVSSSFVESALKKVGTWYYMHNN